MSRLITIKAYKYAELNDKAKNNFIDEMWDEPFEYEGDDRQGNTVIKYDYFGEWDLIDQIEHCESNDYIFNKHGELVGHLEEVQK